MPIIRVEVDFLTEPEGADRLSGDWLASVQQDLKACIIEGCSVVFRHNSVLGRCEPPNSLKSGSSMSQENTMMAARFSESDDENTLPTAKI